MSWSVSKSGTKAEVTEAIDAAHQCGHMPDSHRAACIAEVDQCDAERVSISAYGHRNTPPTGGNVSITVNKVS